MLKTHISELMLCFPFQLDAFGKLGMNNWIKIILLSLYTFVYTFNNNFKTISKYISGLFVLEGVSQRQSHAGLFRFSHRIPVCLRESLCRCCRMWHVAFVCKTLASYLNVLKEEWLSFLKDVCSFCCNGITDIFSPVFLTFVDVSLNYCQRLIFCLLLFKRIVINTDLRRPEQMEFHETLSQTSVMYMSSVCYCRLFLQNTWHSEMMHDQCRKLVLRGFLMHLAVRQQHFTAD